MNTKKKFYCFLIVIVMIITSFCFVAFSKYLVSLSGVAGTSVALFQNSTSVSINDIKGKPGSVTIIPLHISNYDGSKTSEVDSKFTINISHDYGKNIPLVAEVYKDRECSELVYKDEMGNFFDSTFTFKASKRETKNVYLKIEWPVNENKYENVFEIDYLTLNFRVSQID